MDRHTHNQQKNSVEFLFISDPVITCSNYRKKMAGNTNQNTLIQETEVQAIKAEFDGTCRIIKDLGEFTYVVTLQPSGKDIIYKFQMTGIHRWYSASYNKAVNERITILIDKFKII